MKIFQRIVGVIIFLVIGVLVGWSLPRAPGTAPVSPDVVEQAVTREVSVMFDEGDGTIRSFSHESFQAEETLFDVTKRILEREGLAFEFNPPGEYGIMITKISDKVGGTDNKYWSWWLNGEMGQVAADRYVVQPGDVIEWQFLNLKF